MMRMIIPAETGLLNFFLLLPSPAIAASDYQQWLEEGYPADSPEAAAGILLLEEQGKLSVTDDIKTYLPDYPTHGQKIWGQSQVPESGGDIGYGATPFIR